MVGKGNLEEVKLTPHGNVPVELVEQSNITATIESIQGKYELVPPTLKAGDKADLHLDINANFKSTLATALDPDNDSVIAYPPGCQVTEVDLATDADVIVTADPAYLVAIHVTVAMSAQDALIKNATTVKITLPASTAAGINIDCHSATFADNITIESDNAATGKLLVFWRAA